MSTSEPENNAYEPTVTSEPASGTQGVGELAGAGIRIGVGIIDSILVGVGGFIFGLVAGGALLGLLFGGAAGSGEEAAAAVVGVLVGSVIGVTFIQLSFVIIEGIFGVSPAGKMLGIKVAQADGSLGSFGNYFIRALVKSSWLWLAIPGSILKSQALLTVALILSVILTLGLFMALGESKQTLYDKLTGTAVILTK